jgi:trehalose 6-phosphate synthase/phosphatase
MDRAVLIEVKGRGKGFAAKEIFEENWGSKRKNGGKGDGEAPDFVFVAGDDREDEQVFRWANNELVKEGRVVTTVSVGKKGSEAMATLTQGTNGEFSLPPSLHV